MNPEQQICQHQIPTNCRSSAKIFPLMGNPLASFRAFAKNILTEADRLVMNVALLAIAITDQKFYTGGIMAEEIKRLLQEYREGTISLPAAR
jgi:hypothetical protein